MATANAAHLSIRERPTHDTTDEHLKVDRYPALAFELFTPIPASDGQVEGWVLSPFRAQPLFDRLLASSNVTFAFELSADHTRIASHLMDQALRYLPPSPMR